MNKIRLVRDTTVLMAIALFLALSAAGAADQALISLDVRDADVREVLLNLAARAKLNVLLSPKIKGTITCRVQDMEPRELIEFIARTNGFVLEDRGRILLILGEQSIGNRVRFEVIPLMNASAQEVAKMIQTLKMDKSTRVTHDERTNRLIIVYDE
jgi:type II secretory pathway component GspD/PulD (secretin)